MAEDLAAVLEGHLRPGCRVAVGDGAGAPVGLLPALAQAARAVGGVTLLVGWCLPGPDDPWAVLDDAAAFPRVEALMGGYALRRRIESGRVVALPVRMGVAPSWLATAVRPDVAVLGLTTDGAFGTEVGWLAAAAEAAEVVLAEVNHDLPAVSAEPPLRGVHVIATAARPPLAVADASTDPTWQAIGARVAALVPEGASVQVGPGAVGRAVLDALTVPVHIDSGVLVDAVVDLDARGLLLEAPSAAYVVGAARLYRWAQGRPIARRVEHTHDASRLAALPFVAVNTALEVDVTGQVNVESIHGAAVGGIGGHPDYAAAAARSVAGLSVIALPSRRRGLPTLVERLSAPVSTLRGDVDVVVTELGIADLRGRSDTERAAVLAEAFGISSR